MSKTRIDALLIERGLFESRSRAAAAVIAGEVYLGLDGERASKPGQLVGADIDVSVVDAPRYVSRGGTKLANALEALSFTVTGRSCLDIGASTGGFTDCLLQRGAASVAAVDVGYGEFDWRLRQDPRVSVIERTNARNLRPEDLPFEPELAVIDLSFISLEKVFPAVARVLAPEGDMLAMVKPQFEVGRDRVGRGVVHSAEHRREALVAVGEAARSVGFRPRAFVPSGLPGPKGNLETFLWCDRGEGGADDLDLYAEALRADP